jgi:hypothetical protein
MQPPSTCCSRWSNQDLPRRRYYIVLGSGGSFRSICKYTWRISFPKEFAPYSLLNIWYQISDREISQHGYYVEFLISNIFFVRSYDPISSAGKKGAAGKREPLNLKLNNSAITNHIKLLSIDLKIMLKFKKTCTFVFSKFFIFWTKNWHFLKIAFLSRSRNFQKKIIWCIYSL